jgi:uncharacterized protein (DUF362 family)
MAQLTILDTAATSKSRTLDTPEAWAVRTEPCYNCAAPFHPDEQFPEYAGPISSKNNVYTAIRNLFVLMELDRPRLGTMGWNPLGEIIRPGDRVVLKPNLLSQAHRLRPADWNYVITHGAVVRAVADYVITALKGEGEIWVIDGPQLDSDWGEIASRDGLNAVVDLLASHRGIRIRLLDLRSEWWPNAAADVTSIRQGLSGDPSGSQQIDLRDLSAFRDHAGGGRYYGSDYDQAETNRHHSGGRHEYLVSRTGTSADVFINLPKMKTHKKVGATLALKNLVGINTGRNWLPHHTDGSPADGGDAFPERSLLRATELGLLRRFERWTLAHPGLVSPAFRIAKRLGKGLLGDSRHVIRQGNWHGNDTCWRMVHDINRCLLYANGDNFPVFPAKRYLAIVDGIIGGEADGPAAPDPVASGVLVAGFNPVAVDVASAWIMGFDPARLPVIREAFRPSPLPLARFALDDVQLLSNRPGWNGKVVGLDSRQALVFKPHPGWEGHVELLRSD